VPPVATRAARSRVSGKCLVGAALFARRAVEAAQVSDGIMPGTHLFVHHHSATRN
jgi:hypothetical protein